MRDRLSPTLLLTLAALAGCAPRAATPEVQALAEQVQALQARVTELETFQQRVEMVVDLPEDPEKEMAALDLAYEARDALGAGESAQAVALLERIVNEYPDTQVAPAAQEMLGELRIIGSDAGDLDVVGWVQGEHTLDPQALTILVFFEAWCPHCKREMPSMQATYEALDDSGLDVVGVTNFSRSTSESAMQEFIDEAALTFPIGRDDGSLSRRFAANGVPHAAVVRGGKVEWIGHPSELTQDLLKGWLGQ